MCGQICLNLAARDVHLQKRNGAKDWKVNEKAKKRAEVSMRKLQERQARIPSCNGSGSRVVSRKRGCRNRCSERDPGGKGPAHAVATWVLSCKRIENESGVQVGQKAKARLIVKGFMDLDLLKLKRESPTLSTQHRSLLLSVMALNKWNERLYWRYQDGLLEWR